MHPRDELELRVGAAKVDISPEKGIQIAGDIGRRRPCTGILDPIFARALVLEQGSRRYCILSIEVLAIDNPWADEIRRRARKEYGLAPEAVMIHITQNHAAPSIGNHFCRDECNLFPAEHQWLRGGDERYNEPAVSGTIAAIGKALENMVPVSVSVGRTMDGRVAFNRRFVMRDGTAVCHPPRCSPNILHAEGPTDPEVGVVTFTAHDGRVPAVLLHHTCHPCHGFGGNEVTGGWPGAWCREMEGHFGGACTALVINGCCGNVHHCNHVDPAQVDDYKQMGRLLAESAKRALKEMKRVEARPFAWTRMVLPIPRREISDALLASARKMLEDHPQPLWKDAEHIRVEWDWVYAVGIIDIADERRTSPDYPYEIQALRIGDYALLALMGEPFVEAQLRIKRESPFPFTHVAHMCNGYLGYVPTKRAFAGGGYETRTGRGSRLTPDALEMVENASIDVLRELHASR
jgi:neutral ceramidase